MNNPDIGEIIQTFALSPRHYYIMKLRTESNDTNTENVTVHCMFSGTGRDVVLELPITSSREEDYARPGVWLERYFVFRAGQLEDSVTLFRQGTFAEIKAVLLPWHLELLPEENYVNFQSQMESFRRTIVRCNGHAWPVFVGLESLEILPSVASDEHHHSSLFASEPETPARSKYHVACWGDNIFVDTVAQSFSAEALSAENVNMLDCGLFDAVLVQERSAKIHNTKFNVIQRVFNSANCPVFIVKDNGYGKIQIHKKGDNTVQICGYEHDLLNIIPSDRNSSLHSIAVPCASDLYQFTQFQDIINNFAEFGFKISIFESKYNYRIQNIWKRFNDSKLIKVFGNLRLDKQISIFRNCAFVILCSYSLRNYSDILNSACAALMSGSIPILIGDSIPSYEFIDSFYSFEEACSYIRTMDNILFNKIWISKFRRYMQLTEARSTRIKLLYDICGINNFSLHKNTAEFLCVSKRPDNIHFIIQNISRQTYKNISTHIIWNVPSCDFDYCKQISKKISLPNIRISCIDQQYNIGYCLNYGITQSEASLWFKMDDDDYYGSHYIEDMIHYYNIGNFDAVFKPPTFIKFSNNTLYAKKNKKMRMLQKGLHACGATLSGNKYSLRFPFSVTHRNSCDSTWIEGLWSQNFRIFIADDFNFCINRNDVKNHTWQVSDESLQKNALLLGYFSEEWINAD